MDDGKPGYNSSTQYHNCYNNVVKAEKSPKYIEKDGTLEKKVSQINRENKQTNEIHN
jgi:hypothetical protein